MTKKSTGGFVWVSLPGEEGGAGGSGGRRTAAFAQSTFLSNTALSPPPPFTANSIAASSRSRPCSDLRACVHTSLGIRMDRN